MLLVQQPQHPSSVSLMPYSKQFNISASHRRNPSAPAAVVQGQVQPTKTPGLLSLSKPSATRQPRHPTPRQPRSKPQHPQQLQGASPERHRGRNNSSKDKSARPVSKPRAGHGGRARQPSPSPIPQSEQSSSDETVAVPPNSTSVIATGPKPQSSSAQTTVLSAPSGRLAKRRNCASIPFPSSASTPSVNPKAAKSSQNQPPRANPVPVPVKPKVNNLPISRSDPVLSHFPQAPLRSNGADVFPICDDNDDGDDEDAFERPTTPSPAGRRNGVITWQQDSLFNSDSEEGGPRTAPISMKAGVAKHYFPSPVPSPSRPYHKRTPSVPADGMFDLSFGSDNELNASEMNALFGHASSNRMRYDGSVRSTSTPLRKPDAAATFNKFASPMFQNSPRPEQLRPPTFSLAKMKKALVAQSD